MKKANWNFIFGETWLISDFRLYPGDTNVCETIIATSRESHWKETRLIFHTSSCRLGVAFTHVTWCLLFPSSCSSVLVDQCCAKCIREWRTISDNKCTDARVAKYVIQKHIFAWERQRDKRMGVDFMHAIRVDGICIFKIIAREYSLSQLATTDTR